MINGKDLFGWDLPAGAAHDPHAPYNDQGYAQCPMCRSVDTAQDPIHKEEWHCLSCTFDFDVRDE